MQSKEFIAGQPKIEAVKDKKDVKLANLRFIGQFDPGIKSSHPKYRYEDKETGRPFIVKTGPAHCVRSDFVGSKIFSSLGLSAIDTSIDINPETDAPVVIMPDISGSYKPLSAVTGSKFRKEGLKLGDFLTKPEQQEKFKDTILAALLIGDYDRVPWNVMAAKDGSGFVSTDFGASMGSKARGGFNGFPPHIDQEEMTLVLKDPYDILPNANELHADVIEITPGRPVIKDRERLASLAGQMKTVLTNDVIDAIVRGAHWPDNSTEEGRRQNVAMCNEALSELKYALSYEYPDSLGYTKAERAMLTYGLIKEEFGCDFAAYFSFALKARRDDLIEMFGNKI